MHRYILAIISIFISLCSFDASSCTSAVSWSFRGHQRTCATVETHRDCGTETILLNVFHRQTLHWHILPFSMQETHFYTKPGLDSMEAGLAIMNTASYNLAPDTARIKRP